jgi:hypothetical protein
MAELVRINGGGSLKNLLQECRVCIVSSGDIPMLPRGNTGFAHDLSDGPLLCEASSRCVRRRQQINRGPGGLAA